MKAAILASGRGSNADAILKNIESGNLVNLEVVALITDIVDALALEVGKSHHVRSLYLDPMRKGARFSEEGVKKYIDFLKSENVELVILAGFMRILPPEFVDAFKNRIINLHPSLLPLFKGKDAIKQAFDAGVKQCGCTVHFVSNELDGGEIIAQKTVDVMPNYTLDILESKVHQAEHLLLPQVIADIAAGKIKLG